MKNGEPKKKQSNLQYVTDHSYFITNTPDETVLLDEDMATKVNNREKDNDVIQ